MHITFDTLKFHFKIMLLILVLLPSVAFTQKTKSPDKSKAVTKSGANLKSTSSNTGASTEVLFYITKKEFYDLGKEIDISVLENLPPRTGVLFEYYGPQSIDCHKTLDYEANLLLREVRQKKDNLNYSLVVDWEMCKIISLEPDLGSSKNHKPSYMVYHINLTPDSPLVKTKAAPIAKSDAPPGIKRPLLVTRINNYGEWVATGPYGSSQPYNTETEALTELFFNSPGAVTFLCKRDYFNIYVINSKVDNVRLDVRGFLKELGIKDIPN